MHPYEIHTAFLENTVRKITLAYQDSSAAQFTALAAGLDAAPWRIAANEGLANLVEAAWCLGFAKSCNVMKVHVPSCAGNPNLTVFDSGLTTLRPVPEHSAAPVSTHMHEGALDEIPVDVPIYLRVYRGETRLSDHGQFLLLSLELDALEWVTATADMPSVDSMVEDFIAGSVNLEIARWISKSAGKSQDNAYALALPLVAHRLKKSPTEMQRCRRSPTNAWNVYFNILRQPEYLARHPHDLKEFDATFNDFWAWLKQQR